MNRLVDESREERIIDEVLRNVETYVEGDSEEGPWRYRSLTIKRTDEAILVFDVDGQAYERLNVDRLYHSPDADEALRERFNEINEASLNAL